MMRQIAGDIDGVDVSLDVFDDPREALKLYERHKANVEALVFGGPIAHDHLLTALARVGEEPALPVVHVPYNEVSIYRALYDLGRDARSEAEREFSISIDHPASRDIAECLAELELQGSRAYARECGLPEDAPELVGFHRTLWEAGKVSANLTSVFYVYTRLRRIGAPAYRIYPAKSAVRQAIRSAVAMVERERRTRQQVGVMALNLGLTGTGGMGSGATDVARKRRLPLEQLMRAFARELSGVLHWSGATTLSLVTSRGALEQPERERDCARLLAELSTRFGLPSVAGIGFASTHEHASALAEEALSRAGASGAGSVVRIDAEGRIVCPVSGDRSIDYAAVCREPPLLRASEQAGVGVATVGKIVSLAQRADRRCVTAPRVANALGITERSARRILSRMSKTEVLEVCGKEQISSRGRPRRVYRLSAPHDRPAPPPHDPPVD